MKPRKRPGKPAAGDRLARTAMAKAKPLSPAQLDHLRSENPGGSAAPKAGRGGKRADWDIDYSEGQQFASKPMPWRENEGIVQDGMRKFPKNGR